MTRAVRLFALVAAVLVVATLVLLPKHGRKAHRGEAGPYPSDWFGMQRAFPHGDIDQQAYLEAVEQARVERAARTNGTQAGLVWEEVGPKNVGGRVTALAVAPGGTTIYLASANGGVFKSTNSGINWSAIFDIGAAYSVGALALDPGDPNVLYVGTGEANASVDSYDGNGLFRTLDGGQTWISLGLAATRRIARVAIDPSNPQRIYVAAMGSQFSSGPDRGLYRSEDGGQNWSKVLFVSDSTGACDVVINPAHPETVYCATWERLRRPTYRRAFGPECGIYRSVDSGTTWNRLLLGLPTPSDQVGRIGLAIAPSRPSTIYAQIISGSSLGYIGLGFYRSLDGGNSWARRDVAGFADSFGGFGWYFGDTEVDPANPDQVYALGVWLITSTNGGANFQSILGSGSASAHVDQHALWIDPANAQHLYLGNDGGFFTTNNGGVTWDHSIDLPITQFYAGAIDPSNSARLLGGTQDNNTLITSGTYPAPWNAILGGDGFYCLVDPTDPQVIFAEYQFASGGEGPLRSPDGGASFFGPSGISLSDRFNWNAPFTMNSRNHNTLLAGSQRVYRSRDNGFTYSAISADLTTNRTDALVVYSTITTLEIARADTNYYYVGTDDARVWRTKNGGGLWEEISAGLPKRWVTRVAADPANAQIVYVTLSGFQLDELAAHVYRSVNAGDTWTPISSNLPNVPANDIVIDPSVPGRLYLATDIGVYASDDSGADWYPLGTGLPLQTVFDLTLDDASRTLVAATHGRSQWKLDVSALPVAVGDRPLAARLSLSAPEPNPSRGQVALNFDLPSAARAEVAVFDVMGRRIRGLVRETLEAGPHRLVWDGLDDRGQRARAGVYYVRAAAGSGAASVQRLVRSD